MTSEEFLEKGSNEVASIVFPMKLKHKVKKKEKLRKFFTNEDVILILFSLGASAIIITLMIIAGVIGAKIPIGTWWF
ncbi:MAG: hypothetical protein ACFFG0_39745 [Candidatus Thorarchaeota archaeon]